MSLELVLFSAILSLVATCIMSYLAVSIEITFWVAPLVSLLIVMMISQLVRQKWSKEHAVILLATGSLGEMIGLSIGFSWPTLYFLHKNIFLSWMEHPLSFASMITVLIIAAGSLAAVIAYQIRPYLIQRQEFLFPSARLVHDMIHQPGRLYDNMVARGVFVSGIWSAMTFFWRRSLQGFWLLQVHAIPTLLSMGFVAGYVVVKPLMVGLITRTCLLYGIKNVFYKNIQNESFVLTFSLGILSVIIGRSLFVLIKRLYEWESRQKGSATFFAILQRLRTYSYFLIAGLLSYAVLHYWHMTAFEQSYLVVAMSIASVVIARVFAQVGVFDLPNYGSFIVVPLGYLFNISQETLLIAFIFSTICLGLIINLLFSWKVADLTRVSFERMVKYQTIGFCVAAMSAGFIIWWYATVLHFNTETLFSSQALLQEKFILLPLSDVNIFLLGVMYALVVTFFVEEMAVVIAGCMMDPSIVIWLVLAGVFAYFVKEREKYYPFCFAIYASHAIWLFVQAVLL